MLRVRSFLALAALACGLGAATAAHATIVERVVAVIGERPILLSELRHRARPYLGQLYAQPLNDTQRAVHESEMYRDILNRMIEERLEEQAADKARLSVTAEDIDRGLKQKAASLGLPNTKDLLTQAKAQGFSEQEYRDEVRRQLLEGKLIQLRVMNRVRVNEQDSYAEYMRFLKELGDDKTVELRIIARPIGGLSAAQVASERADLDKAVAECKAKVDFCELVKKYSKNTQTLATCGSNGLQRQSQLLPELETVSRTVKEGDCSDVIDIQGQVLAVVQVYKPPHIPKFEDVKPQMEERAMGGVIDKQRKEWLQDLRRGVYIDVRL